jgi:wobble nucleotide-excising tRNase
MILEVNKMQLKTQQEELYNSNATLITLEDQLKKTTTEGQKAVIKFKIENLKSEIAKFEGIVKLYNTTVESTQKEILDLESGKTTLEMQSAISKLELEMT